MEQVPEAVKVARLAELQAAIDRAQAAFNAACVGRTFAVLLEKPGRHPGQLAGRSPYLQPVQVTAPAALHRPHRDRCGSPRSPSNSLFGVVRAARTTICGASDVDASARGPGRSLTLRTLGTDNLIPPDSDTAHDQLVLAFDDNRLASALFGHFDQNLALIERRLGVTADPRGNHVTLGGPRDASSRPAACWNTSTSSSARPRSRLRRRRRRGAPVAGAGAAVRLRGRQRARHVRGDQPRKRPVRARTAAQDAYMRAMERHALVFGIGPAGTGKT